jgi:hypothetical protein
VIVITLKASLSLGNQEDQCPWGPCSLSSNPCNTLHFPGVSAGYFYLFIHVMVFFCWLVVTTGDTEETWRDFVILRIFKTEWRVLHEERACSILTPVAKFGSQSDFKIAAFLSYSGFWQCYFFGLHWKRCCIITSMDPPFWVHYVHFLPSLLCALQ